MGLINNFFNNSDSVGKSYKVLNYGNPYNFVFNCKKEVVIYTTALADTNVLLDKYLKKHDIDNDSVKVEELYLKKKDKFLLENNRKQLCIVDDDVFTKEEVEELKKVKKLKADKKNWFIVGLDKYKSI